MKKILALTALSATVFASNAAIVQVSSVIDGGSYSTDITGQAYGSFDNVSLSFDISGSLDSFDGIPSSITGFVEGPAAFSKALTFSTVDTYSAGFYILDTTVAGFPTGYYLSFYNGSTLIAKGEIKGGTLAPAPEPQTYAMAAGAALLGFAAFRRARR